MISRLCPEPTLPGIKLGPQSTLAYIPYAHSPLGTLEGGDYGLSQSSNNRKPGKCQFQSSIKSSPHNSPSTSVPSDTACDEIIRRNLILDLGTYSHGLIEVYTVKYLIFLQDSIMYELVNVWTHVHLMKSFFSQAVLGLTLPFSHSHTYSK